MVLSLRTDPWEMSSISGIQLVKPNNSTKLSILVTPSDFMQTKAIDSLKRNPQSFDPFFSCQNQIPEAIGNNARL